MVYGWFLILHWCWHSVRGWSRKTIAQNQLLIPRVVCPPGEAQAISSAHFANSCLVSTHQPVRQIDKVYITEWIYISGLKTYSLGSKPIQIYWLGIVDFMGEESKAVTYDIGFLPGRKVLCKTAELVGDDLTSPLRHIRYLPGSSHMAGLLASLLTLISKAI